MQINVKVFTNWYYPFFMEMVKHVQSTKKPLMCYQVSCYHWNDLDVSNVLYSFDFSLELLVFLNFCLLVFAKSYVPRYKNISYGTSVILIHCNNVWFPWFDLTVTVDHNIPENLHFSIFNNTFWNMFIPLLTFSRLYFPHNFQWNILKTSCLLLYSFFVDFSHSLTISDKLSLFLPYILQSGDWAVLSILCFS